MSDKMVEGNWHLVVKDARLQRSSHIIGVVDQNVYIFGGELMPREPRDNDIFVVDLRADVSSTDLVKRVDLPDDTSRPSPRVGSSATALDGKLYLFSGRGGSAMTPIEERGQLYVFDVTKLSWSKVQPADPSEPYPTARSYHCMTNDGNSKLFVHAGCPENGRLSDLWSFELHKRKWTQHADAPPPSRGGTSICYLAEKLYRMNGFDGQHEQGGSLDIFDVSLNTWSSTSFPSDGKLGPAARSVSALLAIRSGSKVTLLTMFGERDPSALGHAGAGKMLPDWWLYDVIDQNWTRGSSSGQAVPEARGWFDAAVVDEQRIVVAGGLSDSNERLQDLWLLSL